MILPAKLRLNNPHKYGSGICESRCRSLFVLLIQVLICYFCMSFFPITIMPESISPTDNPINRPETKCITPDPSMVAGNYICVKITIFAIGIVALIPPSHSTPPRPHRSGYPYRLQVKWNIGAARRFIPLSYPSNDSKTPPHPLPDSSLQSHLLRLFPFRPRRA